MRTLRSLFSFGKKYGAVIAIGAALSSGAAAEAKPRGGPRPGATTPGKSGRSKAPESPATPASKPGSTAVPISPHPTEIADALPTNLPAALDLHLGREGERKADALAFFAQGLLAEDNADSEAALESFKQAFERDQANADLAVKLAFMLAQRNDAPAGIQVMKDAIKWSPKEPMPLIYLAQLYAKHLRKLDVALRYAEQALALDPNFYPSYLAVYEFSSAAGQPAKAQQVLAKAMEATSPSADFWVSIAQLHAQAYLKEDGVATSAEDLRRMNGLFRKAAEMGKGSALVQAKVGNYFVESRQIKESIPFFQAAMQLRQGNDEDPIVANAGDKLAGALIDSGRKDEAITVLEKVTKDNPLRFETFEILGKLYEDKGDLTRALANYKQSLLLDASEPENHVRILRMQMRMKRFDDAIETAKSARARFPNSARAVLLLAETYSGAKKHTEAMSVFAEAQSMFAQGNEELLNAAFYLSYGAAAEQAGLMERAAELLKKSIELDPNGAAQAYNYLGYMWVDKGQNLDEAGEMIKKAVEMDPENGAFLDSLGWYYYKKGDYSRALQNLLKAEGVTKPEDPVIFDHLGDTYQQLGKAPEALQYWQKSLALDTENKVVAEKIEAAKQKVAGAAKTDGVK